MLWQQTGQWQQHQENPTVVSGSCAGAEAERFWCQVSWLVCAVANSCFTNLKREVCAEIHSYLFTLETYLLLPLVLPERSKWYLFIGFCLAYAIASPCPLILSFSSKFLRLLVPSVWILLEFKVEISDCSFFTLVQRGWGLEHLQFSLCMSVSSPSIKLFEPDTICIFFIGVF